jgi:hypothetical protein
VPESRGEAFKNSLSGVHVTGAVKPGFFDKYDDPIKVLGQLQIKTRDMAVDMFSNSGASPEQLKGLNKVVLHTEDTLSPGTKAAYTKADSAIHVNLNGKDVSTAVTHEIGHHVNDHNTPSELHEQGHKASKIFSTIGRYEAESDHFSNPNSAAKNTYVHAATHHLTGECTKDHGSYSHESLTMLGQGYLDRMKTINPGIHRQLTGGDSNGN